MYLWQVEKVTLISPHTIKTENSLLFYNVTYNMYRLEAFKYSKVRSQYNMYSGR